MPTRAIVAGSHTPKHSLIAATSNPWLWRPALLYVCKATASKKAGYAYTMIVSTRFSATVLVCLALAGCASTPVYRPAIGAEDYGYDNTAVGNHLYRVRFAGDYRVARETVENLALYRAAEVARAHGATMFRIRSRNTNVVTTFFKTISSAGYGVSASFSGEGPGFVSGHDETRYETVLEIEIATGQNNKGPHVYNAREVTRFLASTVAAARR